MSRIIFLSNESNVNMLGLSLVFFGETIPSVKTFSIVPLLIFVAAVVSSMMSFQYIFLRVYFYG